MFAEKCSSLNLHEEIVNTLRTHIHENVKWAQDYRSAVDSALNNPDLHGPDLPPPYMKFADVSRSNDGPVLGEQVSAPEIAALVYTSSQQDKECSSHLPSKYSRLKTTFPSSSEPSV